MSASWVMLFPRDDSPDETRILDRTSPNNTAAGIMWGTLVQHGSQVISSESGTYNSVISCRFNPIWLTDRYEFFLGAAISKLELANKIPRPPGSMSIDYAHGHHVNKFLKVLVGIPETGSSELFPSPPQRSHPANSVQQSSAALRVSSRPLSRGPRQFSNVQNQVSTITSTDRMRREITASVTSDMSAQLQQFHSLIIAQQTASDLRFNSLMATMEAFFAGSRNGNAATTNEDV